FRAKLRVPPRALAKLPAGLALEDTRGEGEASGGFEGSALAPKLHLLGAARGGRGGDPTFPVGPRVDPAYDGAAGDARSQIRSPRSTLLEGTAHVDARAADLLAAAPTPWTGGGRVRLVSFPLASLGPLADRGMRGTASGELTVEGLHARPRAKLDLDVTS